MPDAPMASTPQSSSGVNLMDSILPKAGSMASSLSPSGPNVQVKTLADLVAERESKQNSIDLKEKSRSEEFMSSLSGYLGSLFTSSRTARITVASSGQSLTNELLECERQCRGEYDPEKLAYLNKQQGSKAFKKITDQKCSEAEAWLHEIYSQTDEKPWMLVPDSEPEISPDLQEYCREKIVVWAQKTIAQLGGAPPTPTQLEEFKNAMHDELMSRINLQAYDAAVRMETKIDGQLSDAGFQKELAKFLYDLPRFPFACMKTAVRMKKKLKYVIQKDGSFRHVVRKDIPSFVVERVSPFDIFFSPRQSEVNSGYLFERVRCSRAELNSMKGVPGYNDDMIEKALAEFGVTGRSEWVDMEWTKLLMEGKLYTMGPDSSDIQIDTLEFHGSVQGRLLKTWDAKGMKDLEDTKEYEISAILIGNYVIKAVLEDEIGMRPYFICSFYPQPDTIWGDGIPRRMRTEQTAINGAWRAMENNIAICSGPQAMIDDRLISGKENTSDIHPFKVWHYQSKDGMAAKPIDFFNPQSQAERLIQNLQFLEGQVDFILDIPSYQAGMNPVAGAGSTAKGLAMLMSASGKTIKRVVKNVDDHVFIPMIEWFYRMNMLYDEDRYSKGSLNVHVRGTFSMETEASKTQNTMQFLQMVLAPGSPLAQMFGRKGIAELLRPLIKQLKLHDETIIPTVDRLELLDDIDDYNAQQQAQAQAQQAQADAALKNQKATSENSNRQAKLIGAANNAVQVGSLSPAQGRAIIAQTSELGKPSLTQTPTPYPQQSPGPQQQQQPPPQLQQPNGGQQ